MNTSDSSSGRGRPHEYIYEFSRAFWAAFNTTYYACGSTTIDGDKGEQLENVRLGLELQDLL